MAGFGPSGPPLLWRLLGASNLAAPRSQAFSSFHALHPPGRREFLRARICADATGTMRAAVYPSASSGILSSLTWSDGLVEVHEDLGDVNVGDALPYLPYAAL